MMAKEPGKCALKIIAQTEGGRGRVGGGGNGRCQTRCGIRFGIVGCVLRQQLGMGVHSMSVLDRVSSAVIQGQLGVCCMERKCLRILS